MKKFQATDPVQWLPMFGTHIKHWISLRYALQCSPMHLSYVIRAKTHGNRPVENPQSFYGRLLLSDLYADYGKTDLTQEADCVCEEDRKTEIAV